MSEFAPFLDRYRQASAPREKLGIPPLPLDPGQLRELGALLAAGGLTATEAAEALTLLGERVSPGIAPAARAKALFLAKVATGRLASPHLSPSSALELLGQMGGGANVEPLVLLLDGPEALAAESARHLGRTTLLGPGPVKEVARRARAGNPHARETVRLWAEGEWFTSAPAVPSRARYVVVRTGGEINTDLLSPAQEAGTRDDIPLHALSMLSASARDRDLIGRMRSLREQTGLPLLFAGDVLGTGSSRKSASNSLVWWIGQDIPHVPNKRRGGLVMAAKIAPIFFNTLRGCGALPVRCPTGELAEGEVVEVDLQAGTVTRADDGTVLTRFCLSPASLLDEVRAGGRNLLIIGRKLTFRARELAEGAGVAPGPSPVAPPPRPAFGGGERFTLAQKLVGAAAGLPGVCPGDYVEPKASLVFSQDTTGRMTQQELEELACTGFAAPFIQSFCHTPAGPRSRDARMHLDLAAFVEGLGGIALRPGDGIIHTVGNRFLLPYFVGTGGDSHTRFPIGISFPAGSDMVAFAASQGYLPLDMPESVLVTFRGKPGSGLTTRDLVNAIPWTALRTGQLNLAKGDQKVNVFADRILEMEGLAGLSVEDTFRLTDTAAERSAAAATFRHPLPAVVEYVRRNLAWIREVFAPRSASPQVAGIVRLMEEWLAHPTLLEADPGASYADAVVVELGKVTEPLLAAPNDPDRIVTLSEAAGTRVDEVFVGSCMTDLTDFLACARLLAGRRVAPSVRLWTVPPDRETASLLAREGVLSTLMEAGANVHVPGCSLCMGNQAQVSTGATVLSTSTRNFDNRMGAGAQVYLASSLVAAMTAATGVIPSADEYHALYRARIAPHEGELRRTLAFG